MRRGPGLRHHVLRAPRRFAVAAPLLGLATIVGASPVLAGGWQPVVRHTRDGDSAIVSYQSLAASAGRVHLILERDGVEYRRSPDGGSTWQAGVVVARNSATRAALPLAVDAAGDVVVVLFRTRGERPGPDVNRLWLRRSTDGGATWRAPQLLDEYRHRERMGYGGLAIAGAVVHVAWTDRVTGSIWYRRSPDDGATFGAKRRIGVTTFTFESAEGTQTDGLVGVAASSRYVHVTWFPANAPRADDVPVARGVALRSSADGGRSFAERRDVGRRGVVFFPSPTIAASGPRVLLLYELADDARVFVARSSDGGRSFTRTVISDPEQDRLDAWRHAGDIAISGRRAVALIHLTDDFFVPEFRQRTRLAIRRSGDGGRTWGPLRFVVGERPRNKSFSFLNVVVGRSYTTMAFQVPRADPSDETNVLTDVYTRTGP